MATEQRNWSMGLIEACCAEGALSCLWATCCSCCAYGQNHAKFYGDTEVPQDPCSMVCTGMCWAQCAVASFTGLYCILPCLLRQNIRQQFDINGVACCDCGCGPCCDDCCTELMCVYGCAPMQVRMTLKAMME